MHHNHRTGLLDWNTVLEYCTGLLDWTTGLTQTAKYTSEQKLNVFTHSVALLTLLPTAHFLRFSRGQRSHAI